MARKLFLILWLLSAIIFNSSVFAEDVSNLLEEGIYAEETKGDLKEAMTIYQKIIDDNAGNSANIAEAYYRLGACYLKTGEDKKAIEMFKELLTGFREHEEIAADARFQLAKLNALDVEEQTSTPLKLGPAPWQTGETCWYNFGTPVIENYGKMILSVRDVVIDGNDLWRMENYLIIPGEGQSLFGRSDVFKKDSRPFSARVVNGILGNFKAKYEKDYVHLDMDTPTTKETKEIPINKIVYDNDQFYYLFRQLPLNVGYSTSLSLLIPATGNIMKIELKTTGLETVKVPAGIFECYCVELELDSKAIAKQWVSTDYKRYLIKMDIASQGVMELEKIEHLTKDEPEVFSDSESGISISVPQGWHIFKGTMTGPLKMVLQIIPPELKANSTFALVQHLGTLPAAQDDIWEVLKQYYKNHTIRPESWVYGEINSSPSSSYIADYDKEDKKMIEYRTYILNNQELGVFELHVEKEPFNEVKPAFDNIIHSIKWNKK